MAPKRKFIVNVGDTFGRLTVLEEVKSIKDPTHHYYKCICSCGNETIVRDRLLCTGETTSCGCFHKEVMEQVCRNRTEQSEIPNGSVFGKITVLENLGRIDGKDIFYSCQCECGRVFQVRQYTLKAGQQSCIYCRKNKSDIRKKENEDFRGYPKWFLEDLYLEEDRIKAIQNELFVSKKVFFQCKQGHVYEQKVSNHIDLKTLQPRYGCPICKQLHMNACRSEKCKQKRVYPQWFIDELVKQEDKERAISGDLVTTEKVDFKCATCGEIYTQRISHHINLSTQEPVQKCPDCRYKKSSSKHREYYRDLRVYPQWFIDKLVNPNDKKKCINGELKSKDFITLQCDKGHIYTQVVSSALHLLSGEEYEGCPKCGCCRSKNELEIESYIHSLGFSTQHKRGLFDDSRGELDIYIPEKKIAIEYNGSYWHRTLPEDSSSKDVFYHQNKFLSCLEKGIHLISIFDVDYDQIKEKILFYIKDLLLDKERIFARKCVCKKVGFSTATSFYEKYHLLGKTQIITVSYGLFYNDELVSCMSFQKGRYKNNNNPAWSLTRFATKYNCTIIGGASRLLRSFEKEYSPDILVSYSDNDYFIGTVYSKLGFVSYPVTRPRYYWNLNNKEIKREQTQLKYLLKQYPELYKESLLQSGNKEEYIMLSLGASKVYRSGSKRWVKQY